MNEPDLSRLTPQAAAAYREGLAIVSRKREAAAKAKADREAEQAKRSAQDLVKQMGTALAQKCFGVSTAKPFASTSKAAKAPLREETHPRATRFLSVSAGTNKHFARA